MLFRASLLSSLLSSSISSTAAFVHHARRPAAVGAVRKAGSHTAALFSSACILGTSSSATTTVRLFCTTNDSMDNLHPDTEYPHLMRPSKVVLGYNNEHVAVELALLDHLSTKNESSAQKELSALMITGGGDNFLSVLAHPAVSSVMIVDQNPIQQALAQLKLALATSDLSTQDILTFMGTYDYKQQSSNTMDRLHVYETKLKPQLPPETATMLEDNILLEIKHGYNRFGSLENATRHLNHLLKTKGGITLESLWDGSVDMNKLEEFCTNPDLMTMDEYFHVAGFEGKLPPHVANVIKNKLIDAKACFMAPGHLKLAQSGIQNHLSHLTYFHQYTDDHKPEWLDEDRRAALRDKQSGVQLFTGRLQEAPAAAKYDLISTSNIFDWAPTEATVGDVLGLAGQFLRKDSVQSGIMVLRLGFGGGDALVEGVKDALHIVPGFDMKTLGTIETAPYFHKVPNGLVALQHKG